MLAGMEISLINLSWPSVGPLKLIGWSGTATSLIVCPRTDGVNRCWCLQPLFWLSHWCYLLTHSSVVDRSIVSGGCSTLRLDVALFRALWPSLKKVVRTNNMNKCEYNLQMSENVMTISFGLSDQLKGYTIHKSNIICATQLGCSIYHDSPEGNDSWAYRFPLFPVRSIFPLSHVYCERLCLTGLLFGWMVWDVIWRPHSPLVFPASHCWRLTHILSKINSLSFYCENEYGN